MSNKNMFNNEDLIIICVPPYVNINYNNINKKCHIIDMNYNNILFVYSIY